MKTGVCLALAACGLGALCLAGSSSERWPVREQETIEKTLPLSGSPDRLIVDNLRGVCARDRFGGSSGSHQSS